MLKAIPTLRIAMCLIASAIMAGAQTLTLNNKVQVSATLTNTTVTMTGKAELHITGTGDPISGCVINLNSTDAWFFMRNIVPSTVTSTFLGRIYINGAAAVADTNCRVVEYGPGTVVIPHGSTFAPMTVYDGKLFTGNSASLTNYTNYNSTPLANGVRSFKLKRGYTATVAQAGIGDSGTAHVSRNYVAADGDLEVSVLPGTLDKQIQFIRVFPWRWASKKGIAGGIASGLNVQWDYDWNIGRNSIRDVEYVPIRQTRWWPDLAQNWQTRGSTHLLGYNEPDNTSQANIAVGDAIWSWPDLLGTGLRVGSPAPTDGGRSSWLYPFVTQADTAGLRIDYTAVHYYWCFSPGNPTGAANQMYNFLKEVYDNTKRPIWITEWNNGADWTGCGDPTYAQQQAAVAAMVNMLESTPFVERYSLYNWVEDVRRVKWDDGSLTDAGTSYRDKVSTIGYLQAIPDGGIAEEARYTFNGNLMDGFSNGNDAMAVGAPTLVAGKYGQAVSLDGANDYLQLSNGLGNCTDFSFAGWVKWNGGNAWQRIFDFGDASVVPTATAGAYMNLTPSSGTAVRFAISTSGYNNEQSVSGTAKLPTGVWTHVAFTLSGNTGKLFVNGAQVGINTAMTINPVDISAARKYAILRNCIGKSLFAPDPMFSGQLDDMRFYATALSDAQIATIYTNTPPTFSANPLSLPATALRQANLSIAANLTGGSGAITFNKVSGPAWLTVAPNGKLTGVPGVADRGMNTVLVRATDTTGTSDLTTLQIFVSDPTGLLARYAFDGNANAAAGPNAATLGTPTYPAGVLGSSIDLNGTDAYATLPAGIAVANEITVAGWYSRDSTAAWQRLFDFGDGTDHYMFLSPRSGTNPVTMRFAIKNGGAEQMMETPASTTGQWVHFAVTLGSNVGKLYVNGALMSTQAITIKPSDFAQTLNYIGKSQYATDALFDGRVDELLVFNQVLTGQQITALATAGNHAPTFSTNPFSAPSGTVGQAYEQTIDGAASDVDAGNTLTYAKVSGPEWLTVGANGRIAGVPSAADAGTNRFTIRASDPSLLAADAVLNVVVAGPSDLVGHYQFNGNAINNVGGNAATVTGAATYANGLFDNAISLNGTGNYLQLPVSPISTLNDYTIAARVRWNGGNNWQRVFDFGNGTTQFVVITPQSGSGNLRFAICNGGAEQQLNASMVMPSGEWAHVAVTMTGTTGTLYLNGAAVATGTITLKPSQFAPATNYLGKSQFNDPLFSGLMDDFRIYNRGLSASEIATLAIPPASTSVPDSSYAAWVTGYTWPIGKSGPTADPDNDGIPNAWEYLLGTDPLTTTVNAMPPTKVMNAAALGLAGTKTYLTIQPRVRKQHLGTTIVPVAASTLAGLTAADAPSHALQAGAPVADGAYETYTFYYNVAIQDSPTGKGFIRVNAKVP